VGKRCRGVGGADGGAGEQPAAGPGGVEGGGGGWVGGGDGAGEPRGAGEGGPRCRAGERVLVHAAAGGLGVVAVQIARALGARVVATVGSAATADVVRRRRLGVEVDAVLRYDEDGWEKEVREASRGKGVDVVVFDTVGLVETSLRCLRSGADALSSPALRDGRARWRRSR
jgi:NADPH:quinone reductase-like Zn-dependent oxidoreductase